MKSFDTVVQTVLTFSILGLGVLFGLAFAVLSNGLDIGGVGPLFANTMGAAIGAGITLWTVEHRAQKAAKKETAKSVLRVGADLGIILLRLNHLAVAIRARKAGSGSITSISELDHLTSDPDKWKALLYADFVDAYAGLSIELGHVRRIVREFRGQGSLKIADTLNSGGLGIVDAFESASAEIDSALSQIKEYREMNSKFL